MYSTVGKGPLRVANPDAWDKYRCSGKRGRLDKLSQLLGYSVMNSQLSGKLGIRSFNHTKAVRSITKEGRSIIQHNEKGSSPL